MHVHENGLECGSCHWLAAKTDDPGFFSVPLILAGQSPTLVGECTAAPHPPPRLPDRTDTGDKTGLESLRSTGLHNAGSDCPRTPVSCWHLGNMSLRVGSCAFPIPGLLLLGLLLLPAVVAETSGKNRSKTGRAGGPGWRWGERLGTVGAVGLRESLNAPDIHSASLSTSWACAGTGPSAVASTPPPRQYFFLRFVDKEMKAEPSEIPREPF